MDHEGIDYKVAVSRVEKIFNDLSSKDKIKLFDHIMSTYQDTLCESEVVMESLKLFGGAYSTKKNIRICEKCLRPL